MTSNKQNMGFFKCSKYGSLINFQSLNHYWSVLLDHIELVIELITNHTNYNHYWGRLFEGGNNNF